MLTELQLGEAETTKGPSNLFTGCLAPLLGEDFLSQRLSREVVLADAGAEVTKPLITWADLNHILATRPLRSPQLRLYRQGEPIPAEAYTRTLGQGATERQVIQPDLLYAELRDGASLILDAVHALHPPVGAAAEDLVRFVREPVQVNLYATWGTSQGFATHWDDHDVFVVQVMGSKHWRVHGPGRPFPMKRDVTHDHTCPDAIVWDGVIHAGQVLHVPRGWWHGVRGAGDVSVHLTFGFARRTGIDWAEWIIEQLRHRELFRQELPRFSPTEATQAHEEALRAGLREVLASSSLDRYFADRDELAPRRHRFCLPLAVTFRMPYESTAVEFTPLFAHIKDEGDRVVLSSARKRFVFAPILGPLLHALAQHRALPSADLRRISGLDDKTFQLALEVLVEQQLVTIPIVSH